MDSVFTKWTESLSALHASIGQELKEIHRCKAEVQRLRDDMISSASFGQYIHDDKRIVLSAPEIVIGNVAPDGTLRDGASIVVVRGRDVQMQATGNGSVTTRAPRIIHVAEDPGIDGVEHVVQGTSQIVSMARNVVLHGSDATGTFFETPEAMGEGVQIHSDSNLTIDASVPNDNRNKRIEECKKALTTDKEVQKKNMDDLEIATKTIMKDIDKLFQDSEKLQGDEMQLRSNTAELQEMHDRFKGLSQALAETSNAYIRAMATLAETERQLADLDKAKKDTSEAKSNYKEGNTGAAIALSSQNITMMTVDGDGNIREDSNSGITMKAKTVSVNAVKPAGELMQGSALLVNTENVMLDTRSSKLDDKGENGDITTTGSFSVIAKDMVMTAVDSEIKNKETKEKTLVKDSTILFRAEKMKAETTDSEGKAVGSIELNTKQMELKAVDLDKESGKDKEMAQGSSILVFAEKMSLGSRDKDKNKAKQLQLTGEKVAVLGKETTEIQQGDGKAIVQLDGGNLKVSGSATEIYGKTTIQADTEVKGAIKAPQATIDNLEAKSSFKSPDISDGIAVPAPAATSSLSAKLKEEELRAES